MACSAMAAAKEKAQVEVESRSNSWSKWKRGGVIGAAAVTGGTLLAITGGIEFSYLYERKWRMLASFSIYNYLTGLAAPAIAAGFGALAPTLGTIMPVIGASGFAAMASATGSVAGSVAVAASFGGNLDVLTFFPFIFF